MNDRTILLVEDNPDDEELTLRAFRQNNILNLVNGYRLSANSYIRKPVDFTKFMEAVRQIGFYWRALNEPPPR